MKINIFGLAIQDIHSYEQQIMNKISLLPIEIQIEIMKSVEPKEFKNFFGAIEKNSIMLDMFIENDAQVILNHRYGPNSIYDVIISFDWKNENIRNKYYCGSFTNEKNAVDLAEKLLTHRRVNSLRLSLISWESKYLSLVTPKVKSLFINKARLHCYMKTIEIDLSQKTKLTSFKIFSPRKKLIIGKNMISELTLNPSVKLFFNESWKYGLPALKTVNILFPNKEMINDILSNYPTIETMNLSKICYKLSIDDVVMTLLRAKNLKNITLTYTNETKENAKSFYEELKNCIGDSFNIFFNKSEE